MLSLLSISYPGADYEQPSPYLHHPVRSAEQSVEIATQPLVDPRRLTVVRNTEMSHAYVDESVHQGAVSPSALRNDDDHSVQEEETSAEREVSY